MNAELQTCVLESKARDYVLMHPKLKYDAIVAHAAKNYATEADQKTFVEAVLHADIVITNERAGRAFPFPPK